MQIRRFRGRRTVMSFRLCSRAPWTTSSSAAISTAILPGRTDVRVELSPLLEQAREPARHAVDLELAGDDGSVAEDAAEQRPLDLEHRPVERDRRGRCGAGSRARPRARSRSRRDASGPSARPRPPRSARRARAAPPRRPQRPSTARRSRPRRRTRGRARAGTAERARSRAGASRSAAYPRSLRSGCAQGIPRQMDWNRTQSGDRDARRRRDRRRSRSRSGRSGSSSRCSSSAS